MLAPRLRERFRKKKVHGEYYFGASNGIVWIVILEVHDADDRVERKPPAVVVAWGLDLWVHTLFDTLRRPPCRLRCFAIYITSDYVQQVRHRSFACISTISKVCPRRTPVTSNRPTAVNSAVVVNFNCMASTTTFARRVSCSSLAEPLVVSLNILR